MHKLTEGCRVVICSKCSVKFSPASGYSEWHLKQVMHLAVFINLVSTDLFCYHHHSSYNVSVIWLQSKKNTKIKENKNIQHIFPRSLSFYRLDWINNWYLWNASLPLCERIWDWMNFIHVSAGSSMFSLLKKHASSLTSI